MIDISIVITSFNYAAYIEEAINSCLSQNRSQLNFEVIVVDDGSLDETQAVLQRIDDTRVKKFKIQNSGIEIAANYGFSKAMGRYVVRLDADDRLAPIFLSTIEGFLNKNYSFIYSDYLVIDANGIFLREFKLPDFDPLEIMKRGDFLATGTVYKLNDIKKIGFYSTEKKNSGLENYELVLKMLKNNLSGFHIQKYLFEYRRHSFNISETQLEKIILNGKALFLNMGLGEYQNNSYHPYILQG